ncbi:ATP-dependent protease La (LON) substrate-binding domain protein [compost metagenome]
MIGRCMKQGAGFGVVCILEGEEVGQAPEGYALVGCEALIRDFEQQSNGLLGIRVEGGRRFRVLSSEVQRDQLIVAEVEWLPEVVETPLQEDDSDLLALLLALAEHPMVASLNMGTEAAGQQSLANQLAYLLPFNALDKIDLLALDDPQQRLDAIQVLLDDLQGELFA